MSKQISLHLPLLLHLRRTALGKKKKTNNIREGERKRAVERERKAKKRSLYFIPIFFSLRYEIGKTNENVVVMAYDVVDVMVVVVVVDMV